MGSEGLARESGTGVSPGVSAAAVGGTAGVVIGPQYKAIRDPDTRGQQWSTGPVQVSDVALSAKGPLLETGVGGPGGGAVPACYQPRTASKRFEPLGVADLFATSQVTAGQVRYVTEAPPRARLPVSPRPASSRRAASR